MPQVINTISSKGEYIILSSKKFYEDVISIISIYENIIVNSSFVKKYFRWSYNDLVFSNWIELNLLNANTIPFNQLNKFWVEFKYELEEDSEFSINEVYFVTDNKNAINNSKPFNIAYPQDKGNRYWPVKLKSFTWNPYSQEASIKLQKELSYMMNQIHGHEITYFRALPIGQSKTVTFLEYTLYNIDEDYKCLKVLVPDNTFPEHKLNHNAFGLDFELPFEIHIDKRYFEEVFGEGSRPQKRDIIYFPLTNRIYEVLSADIAVQFMYDFLYWHISLQKWQPKINVMQSENISNVFEEFTVGMDEIFKDEIMKLNDDVTNPQQLEDRSYQFDNVVLERISYDIEKNYIFENYYTKVFETVYDFKEQVKLGNFLKTGIKYHAINNISEKDDFVYTSWFNIPLINEKKRKINSIQVIDDNKIKVSYSRNNNFLLKELDSVNIINSDESLNIVGRIFDVNYSESIIELYKPILDFNNQDWINYNDLYLKESFEANLLKSNNGINGIDIDILDKKYLKLKLNDKRIIFNDLNLQYDTWYAIVITISNKFKQLSYHLYTTKDKSYKTTALKLLNKRNINNIERVSYASNMNYSLLITPIMLTNIRILKNIIDEESHNKFLNLYIIKDASNAIIIDNAKPVMKLPYISQPK